MTATIPAQSMSQFKRSARSTRGASPSSRPYFYARGFHLEKLFAVANGDVALLQRLAHELAYRRSDSARSLKHLVDQELRVRTAPQPEVRIAAPRIAAVPQQPAPMTSPPASHEGSKHVRELIIFVAGLLVAAALRHLL